MTPQDEEHLVHFKRNCLKPFQQTLGYLLQRHEGRGPDATGVDIAGEMESRFRDGWNSYLPYIKADPVLHDLVTRAFKIHDAYYGRRTPTAWDRPRP